MFTDSLYVLGACMMAVPIIGLALFALYIRYKRKKSNTPMTDRFDAFKMLKEINDKIKSSRR